MPISNEEALPDEPIKVESNQEFLHVTLADGRTITTPLWWYPRLLNATQQERDTYELSPFGVHWDSIDEDLSVRGMLEGRKAPGATKPEDQAA